MSCPHGLLSKPATCSQCLGAPVRIVRFDEQLGVMTIDGKPEKRGVDVETAERSVKFGRNRKPAITVTRGSLADELHQAERRMLAAREKIEDLLESLYPAGFTSFDCYDGVIDVFGCLASDAAVDALRRAGFSLVWQHGHRAEQFVACECRAR